jgi:DNA-binding TFAR19-related protein (PDSD5 family)
MDDEQKLQQQVQQLEMTVRQHLTSDAMSRFGNIKIANPELAIQLMVYLGQLIKAGKVAMIDDAQLKTFLMHISNTKKDFTIQRK